MMENANNGTTNMKVEKKQFEGEGETFWVSGNECEKHTRLGYVRTLSSRINPNTQEREFEFYKKKPALDLGSLPDQSVATKNSSVYNTIKNPENTFWVSGNNECDKHKRLGYVQTLTTRINPNTQEREFEFYMEKPALDSDYISSLTKHQACNTREQEL